MQADTGREERHDTGGNDRDVIADQYHDDDGNSFLEFRNQNIRAGAEDTVCTVNIRHNDDRAAGDDKRCIGICEDLSGRNRILSGSFGTYIRKISGIPEFRRIRGADIHRWLQ